MDFIRRSYRAATSKTAQRTLLNTVLIIGASVVLYGLAAVAYLLFYHNYLPDQVTTIPIHLQYGYGPNPYGIASLENRNLKDQQAYDITVSLTLPRSPANLERGNFMIALYLLGSDPSKRAKPTTAPLPTGVGMPPSPDPAALFSSRRVLYTSTRPVLIPYTDPLVRLASRVLFLLYHVLFLHTETTRLDISLAERLVFPSPPSLTTTTSGIPSSLFLELQAGQSLQVYSVTVTLTAQLRGLRWLMHRHRVFSFVVGTAAFWACEVFFTVMAWMSLSVFVFGSPVKIEGGEDEEEDYFTDKKGKSKLIKKEEDVMSDTERTFPTTGRQPPLRYESGGPGAGPAARVKQEDGDEAKDVPTALAPGAEADDEEDGDGDAAAGWRDSGIGTSFSDVGGAGGGGLRRRSSRGRK